MESLIFGQRLVVFEKSRRAEKKTATVVRLNRLDHLLCAKAL